MDVPSASGAEHGAAGGGAHRFKLPQMPNHKIAAGYQAPPSFRHMEVQLQPAADPIRVSLARSLAASSAGVQLHGSCMAMAAPQQDDMLASTAAVHLYDKC